MKPEDKKEFLKGIRPLVVNFPYPVLTKAELTEKINIYFDKLSKYKLRAVLGAFDQILYSKADRNFPSIGEIVKSMDKFMETGN